MLDKNTEPIVLATIWYSRVGNQVSPTSLNNAIAKNSHELNAITFFQETGK